MEALPGGVYPTMITPFTEDLRVDYAALEPLLRWYEARGVAGLFAVCQSSEMFDLSFDERLGILQRLMQLRRPGTAMVASGHVSKDIPTAVREAKAFIAEGIDAYIFITNNFAERDEDDDVFLRRLSAVAGELGDFPLGFYECPRAKPKPRYNRLLNPYVIERLPGIGNFVFLKDTCCDVAQIKAKLAAAQGSSLKIYNANAAMLLESLRAGCAGYSGVMANFHPRLYTKLFNSWRSDPALAARIQSFLGPLSAAEGLGYPVNAKYHMQLSGVPMTLATRAEGKMEKFNLNAQYVTRQMRELAMAFEAELGL